MAGLEGLASLIYHEKQEAGSMLCAQHALNSLLQGNYFTSSDLSEIARNLDSIEESVDDSHGGAMSHNMDDTGFFSVQVVENALNVWGLTMKRWRGEDMRPHNAAPHKQMSFILNLQQHWFTLRRFGSFTPADREDSEKGHWYNLNSFLQSPEWVGRLYLGMVIQQAEDEGYSVFAICPMESNPTATLPRTEADEAADTLAQPTSSAMSPSARLSTTREVPENPPIGDEDMDLQAAIQASLIEDNPTAGFPLQHELPQGRPSLSAALPEAPPGEAHDPIAASMARSRALMERMRREQEMALRETYTTEAARFPTDDPGEETIRRAMAENRRYANMREALLEDEYAPEDESELPSTSAPSQQSTVRRHPGSAPDHRVYDDEDTQLQAALRASLEDVPEGFVHPPSPPPVVNNRDRARSITPLDSRVRSESKEIVDEDDEDEVQASSPPPMVSAEPVNIDEMRKMRLAKFGGC